MDPTGAGPARALVPMTALIGWGVVAILIGYIDYVTGPYFSLTVFYLIPVVGAAWMLGRTPGLAVALTAGAASLTADLLLLAQSNSVPLFWNTGSRTIVLAVAAFGVDVIRRDRDHLRLVDAQRTHSLELLDKGLVIPAREISELADALAGATDTGKAQRLRARADEVVFLARDFSTMIRLQSRQLTIAVEKFDLGQLVDELRAESTHRRRITLVRPSAPLLIRGDRARVRQALNGLIGLFAPVDDLSLTLAARRDTGEIMISAEHGATAVMNPDALTSAGLTVELAQLLLAAHGGTVELTRNPITRSLRVMARLPLG